jgi:flagellar hook-basal body complex protein FliE
MNALGSIRQLWSSTPSLPVTGAEQAAAGSTSIPASELRELNATNLSSGVSGIQGASGSFGGLLGQMVQDVNSKQNAATQAVQDMQSGQHVSLHQALISMEEANVSFQLMVEVRNRLLDSYQELMRMQV